VDVIALLKADHKSVRELFATLDETGVRAYAQRTKLKEQICSELERHSQAEERILYPAFVERAKAGSDERDAVLEAEEEHRLLDTLIAELKTLDTKEEQARAKLRVLHALFETHVKEEERSFFPMCREAFDGDELRELGQRVTAFKMR
jgi:iron-sulfur cluster repair protein YtfE (RIC family)